MVIFHSHVSLPEGTSINETYQRNISFSLDDFSSENLNSSGIFPAPWGAEAATSGRIGTRRAATRATQGRSTGEAMGNRGPLPGNWEWKDVKTQNMFGKWPKLLG